MASPHCRILVVDDDLSTRRLLDRMLDKAGYQVLTADNAFQAIQEATRQLPDLILLDVQMPDRNGFEVCAELKAQPFTAAIPIIFVTGSSQSDDIVQGFSAGGCDYVVKPFTSQELLARISVHVRLQQAQEELRRSEERLRTVINTSNDAMIAIDRDRCVTLFNPAAERMYGWAADDMLGKSVDRLIPERMRARHRHSADRFLQHGESVGVIGSTVELSALRQDGTEFPIALTLSSGEFDGGRFVLASIRDITEQKLAQEQQHKLLAVEHERNHLKGAVGALERVLGVVGHELRTPLAGLRAMAEFLLREDARETEEFATFLHGIHDEVVKMTATVNDTLEVARMNSGVAQWNWSTVQLGRVCEEALDTVRPLIDRDKVALSLIVTPATLTMKGDVGAIRRLVVNLLSNAQKHTEQGSISVQAESLQDDEGKKVRIQVRDTGEGISPDIAARLGVAFALNSGVVGENHVKGSGLGLAICQGIVAAHRGTITVHTSRSQGTRITVLLQADLTQPDPIENEHEKPTSIVCEVNT